MSRFILAICILLLIVSCNAQNDIKGVVYSAASGKPVGFANVIVKSGDIIVGGANTNNEGRFKINLLKSYDSLLFEVSKIGYETSDTVLTREILKKEIRLSLGGFSEDQILFDGETAREDIKNGIIQIYHLGLPGYSSEEMNRIASQYGFRYNFLNCETTEIVIESIKRYNEVVEEYLSTINPSGWQDSLAKKIKEL